MLGSGVVTLFGQGSMLTAWLLWLIFSPQDFVAKCKAKKAAADGVANAMDASRCKAVSHYHAAVVENVLQVYMHHLLHVG